MPRVSEINTSGTGRSSPARNTSHLPRRDSRVSSPKGIYAQHDKTCSLLDELFLYLRQYEHFILATPNELVAICCKHDTLESALSYIIDHHLNPNSFDEKVLKPSINGNDKCEEPELEKGGIIGSAASLSLSIPTTNTTSSKKHHQQQQLIQNLFHQGHLNALTSLMTTTSTLTSNEFISKKMTDRGSYGKYRMSEDAAVVKEVQCSFLDMLCPFFISSVVL